MPNPIMTLDPASGLTWSPASTGPSGVGVRSIDSIDNDSGALRINWTDTTGARQLTRMDAGEVLAMIRAAGGAGIQSIRGFELANDGHLQIGWVDQHGVSQFSKANLRYMTNVAQPTLVEPATTWPAQGSDGGIDLTFQLDDAGVGPTRTIRLPFGFFHDARLLASARFGPAVNMFTTVDYGSTGEAGNFFNSFPQAYQMFAVRCVNLSSNVIYEEASGFVMASFAREASDATLSLYGVMAIGGTVHLRITASTLVATLSPGIPTGWKSAQNQAPFLELWGLR